MAGLKRRLTSTEPESHALHKELDQVSCPVCMDHPHNAVLLLCTSHDKGCRSYICDTSHRHSNCLDRLKSLSSSESSSNPTRTNNESLKCPLCRGNVLGFKVVEEVRSYLDLKTRSCSRESCSFSGNYNDLRRHARRTHPTTRPSDTDPVRERAWRSLESQREYGDIVSAVRSAMPGAVVVGDYVIENGDGESSDLWTTLVLFQMIGSLDDDNGGGSSGGRGGGGPRTRGSRAWRNHRGYSDRRNLLGNNNNDDDGEDRLQNETRDGLSRVPRRSRRFGRPRSSGDHQR